MRSAKASTPWHVERLAAYWAEALGGPTTYSDRYGDETTVDKMHSGDGEHDEMNRRAIAWFDLALTDVGLANDVLRQVLHNDYAWPTTATMSYHRESAHDVPNGLSIHTGHGTGSRGNAPPPHLRTFVLSIVAEHSADQQLLPLHC